MEAIKNIISGFGQDVNPEFIINTLKSGSVRYLRNGRYVLIAKSGETLACNLYDSEGKKLNKKPFSLESLLMQMMGIGKIKIISLLKTFGVGVDFDEKQINDFLVRMIDENDFVFIQVFANKEQSFFWGHKKNKVHIDNLQIWNDLEKHLKDIFQ